MRNQHNIVKNFNSGNVSLSAFDEEHLQPTRKITFGVKKKIREEDQQTRNNKAIVVGNRHKR